MTTALATPGQQRPSTPEFIALMAMLMATVAFSIDAMLPALPEIGAELSPGNLNRAQLIVTSFVLGMGLGTFFTGPLSDRFGRKPVVVGGAAVYCSGALIAWQAQTLEMMLAGRVLQGIGAAGPRVVVMALVRDMYSGRQMAKIMSFAMIIFGLVPAFAPTIGKLIITVAGWRSVFLAFLAFSALSVLWLTLRQPETLAPENRRPLRLSAMWAALREMAAYPTVRLSTGAQTLCAGMLFATISSTQQIFDETYGQGANFHIWFGLIAAFSASASVINARLVVRLGMRAIIKTILTVQLGLSFLMALAVLLHFPNAVELWIYVFWTFSLFFQIGLTLGNLNALAMEPMGHIAGTAASLISALSTIGAVMIAAPIGLAFNGTPLPLAIGIFFCAAGALWMTTKIRRDSDPD